MKVLYIHNEYKQRSGEEHASEEIAALLTEHGHTVEWFKKTTKGKTDRLGFKIKAFVMGIYNPFIVSELEKVLDTYKPDIVQVQNIYPLISVAIFAPIKKRNIPIVMRCPNYRLFCPTGLCLDRNGQVCEKCFGKGKELWCVKNNCENNQLQSLGYAARNAYARSSGKILKNVDRFIVQSEFQKEKFILQGVDQNKITIVPGIVPVFELKTKSIELGEWVSFVGRVSEEKGIYEFIEVARNLKDLQFKVAGNLDTKFKMPENLPSNIEFVGFKSGDDLNDFYQKSRIIVVPSKWYEGFPNVITRGMMLAKPIITTNIGAMASIVDNGINGILVNPGDVADLQSAISTLYPDTALCVKMGVNGKEKAEKEYSREQVYSILSKMYSELRPPNPQMGAFAEL